MDASKKAEFEKRAILGLAGVFLLVFMMGPMRSLGGRRRHAPVPSAPVEKVNVGNSLGTLMQEHWDRMESTSEFKGGTHPTEAPLAPPTYTASQLRDPMKSLLPQPPKPSNPNAGPAHKEPPPPPPPPTLHVQGLLWGSSTPKAIINDKVYSVDDRVAGAKILSITRRGVMVEYLGTHVLYPPTASSVPEGGRGR